MSFRLRQIRPLLPAVLRSMRWLPICGSWAGAAAMAALLTRHGRADDPAGALGLPAIVLVLGCAFVLDDPAVATIGSTPTPLIVRRSYCVMLACAGVAVVWAGLVSFVGWRTGGSVPVQDLSLELGTMLALILAIAAVAPRFVPDGRGGTPAGPTLLALVALSFLVKPRWKFLNARIEGFTTSAAHQRILTTMSIALLILLLASRDPGRRTMNRTKALLRQRA